MSGTITLKSGRTITVGGAGDCILGIGADLRVTEGYDSNWDFWPAYDEDPDDPDDWMTDEPPLTAAEKIEVCELMIDRWKRLADRVRETQNS